MTDKFQNKYRIPSARLQNWDYGRNGAYFITICTHNREHYFGKIVDGIMQLNDIGKLAQQYWMEIPNHFSFIALDNFVVMPNHIHGILIIDKMDNDGNGNGNVETPKLGVSTKPGVSTKTAAATKKWKPQTIGSIINQYKRICTINARKIHSDFAWQTRFHDHIIRNTHEHQRIQNYIANNPVNWNNDTFHE